MTPPDDDSGALPPYIIEHARSGRSKCKSCRKTIAKDALRLGVLVEGPYGEGHMWHHLECAGGKLLPKVEEAYRDEAWKFAKQPPAVEDLPTLESLRELGAAAEAERVEKEKNKRQIPYAELAPSDRSKCKQSGEPIPKGAARIVLGKQAVFGNQTRTSAFAVLPEHVAAALDDPEIVNDPLTLVDELRANSKLQPEELERAIAAIGEL